MTEAAPTAIPSQQFLTEHIGSTWDLLHPQMPAMQVKLVLVREEASMNRRFICYSAEFEVLGGGRPPSANYLAHCDGAAWELLFTAIGPGDDGEELLQTIIHTLK